MTKVFRHPPWTDEEIAEIVRLRDEGYGPKRISEMVGRSFNAVRARLGIIQREEEQRRREQGYQPDDMEIHARHRGW